MEERSRKDSPRDTKARWRGGGETRVWGELIGGAAFKEK